MPYGGRRGGGGRGYGWHEYPERGWIQFLILRILYERPTYGYQLIGELEERSYGCHRLEPGSMYTLLRRMERGGLLESRWNRSEGGPHRRMYKVTKMGAEALRSGLEKTVRRKALTDDLIDFYRKNFEGGEKELAVMPREHSKVKERGGDK